MEVVASYNEAGNITNDWKIFLQRWKICVLIAADYVKSNSKYLYLKTAEMFRVANFENAKDSIYWLGTIMWHQQFYLICILEINLFLYDYYYLRQPIIILMH